MSAHGSARLYSIDEETAGGVDGKAGLGSALHVSNLAYEPDATLSSRLNVHIYNCCPSFSFHLWTRLSNAILDGTSKKQPSVAHLHNVTFRANEGQVTAIMGASHGERRTLIDLISSRRKRGLFDGQILLSGVSLDSTMAENTVFVSRKSLYIPGFTFEEMLRYAGKMRIRTESSGQNRGSVETSNEKLERHVREVLDVMNLTHCKDKVLPEEPATRGIAGSELRRLAIAVEIIHLPKLVIVDDPAASLDPGVSISIFSSLKALASRGHIVLLSMPKPSPLVLAKIDSIVLLSDGFSIFASAPQNIKTFFCSSTMGYVHKPETDLMEWLHDIAQGLERPSTQREAHDASVLQERFESSPLYQRPRAGGDAVSAFPDEFFYLWGYARFDKIGTMLSQIVVVVIRALHAKIREHQIIKRSLGGSILVGIVVGYLQFGLGSYGKYTMSLLMFPYLQTSNITATLFFIGAFIFTQQVFNVHLICRKINMFRFEQQARVCSTLAFIVASFLSEVPFSLLYANVFGNILYFMVNLGKGYDNYCYFMEEICMVAMVGLMTAFSFSALLRQEILVRDTFLLSVFLMLLLSGFPFQLSGIRSYMADISQLNPMRWSYEALMNWKFANNYYDGEAYLIPYAFATFDPTHVFFIMRNFFVIVGSITALVLFPLPNTLKKRNATKQTTRRSLTYSNDGMTFAAESTAFDLTFPRTRTAELSRPLLFTRETSVTGVSRLSINLSQTGAENLDHGPTVTFKNITYRIKNRRKASGYEIVLDRVSGQFDWGKLSGILGAHQAGKSSLLHILAGDSGLRSEMRGKIYFNDNLVPAMPKWQRCALVESTDEQMPDLTVKEIVMYAMQLRCLNRLGLSVVEENVSRTLDILHLTELSHTAVKDLTPGERRRLSIAEEIVHGPSLLLIDEPTTHLDEHDASVLMRTFREMVNQDRTVVATLYQPSPAVIALFDTIMLLSKGRVIYFGKASAATTFFVSSPFRYVFAEAYNNPGDFLTDISGGLIKDIKGQVVESTMLSDYYRQSENFLSLNARLKPSTKETEKEKDKKKTPASSSTSLNAAESNPILRSKLDEEEEGFNKGFKSDSLTQLGLNDEEAFEGDDEGTLGNMYMLPLLCGHIGAFIKEGLTCDMAACEVMFLKASILFCRSFFGLLKRRSLVLGTMVAQILLACIFGWILGNSSGAIYNATSFFAVGTLLLVIGNVQLISFLFETHQVFLKEHSRGLYTNFVHWSVSSLSLYFLRALNALFYSLICYNLLVLGTSSDILGFYVLSTILAMLAGTMMSECVVFLVPDIRAAYILVPVLSFVQFAFSGLFLKPALLPRWMAPWAPSISLIRWTLQSQFLNQFENDTAVFPDLPNYSTFSGFCSLFGWGGKTKWYCLNMVIVCAVIFRFLSLFATGFSSFIQRGGRKFKAKQEL